MVKVKDKELVTPKLGSIKLSRVVVSFSRHFHPMRHTKGDKNLGPITALPLIPVLASGSRSVFVPDMH